MKSKLPKWSKKPEITIKIVPMVFGDIAEVKELERANNLSAWSEADYVSELGREDSLALVAKLLNKTIGFVVARLITIESSVSGNEEICGEKGEAEIYNIAVDKDFHRSGIGKMLLHKVCERARKHFFKSIWLDVRESNKNAIVFYIKQGFEAVYTRKNFYSAPSENAIVMCLRLL